MKQVKVKITSATTAKEINPIGDEPKMGEAMCCSVEAHGYEHDAWVQYENKLKKYTITHRTYFYGEKVTKFDPNSMSESGKKLYGVGTIYDALLDEEKGTLILMEKVKNIKTLN